MRDSQTSAWRTTTFGSIALRLVNGGTPPTDVPAFWNGTIPWITGADFTSSGVGEFRRFVSKVAIASTATNVIDKGELLLVTRTGVGKLAIAPCDIAISQDITGVYADRKQVDALFLYHRMRKGVEELKKLNQGTSINGIIRGDLLKYPIDLPPLPQQERIAEILSTLDEAIEQTEALIAKTQAIKAGLMHDLFTRGVTANGELRPPREEAPQLFKASPLGWIPKEWDIASFGACLLGTPQNGIYKPATEYMDSGTSIVRIDSFYDGLIRNVPDLKRVRLGDEERALYGLATDDLLINRVNSLDYVGKSAIVPALTEPLVFESNIMRCRVDRATLLPQFGILWLCGRLASRHFQSRAKSAVAQASINQDDVRSLLVKLPNGEEQKRISERASVIEATCSYESKHQQGLVGLKHGLMHDLLTGRVAVPLPESEAVAADA